MKKGGAEVRTNGATTNASNTNNPAEDGGGGGGLLELICGSLCKDTPLAEMFGVQQNQNQDQGQDHNVVPLQTISNGETFVELIVDSAHWVHPNWSSVLPPFEILNLGGKISLKLARNDRKMILTRSYTHRIPRGY